MTQESKADVATSRSALDAWLGKLLSQPIDDFVKATDGLARGIRSQKRRHKRESKRAKHTDADTDGTSDSGGGGGGSGSDDDDYEEDEFDEDGDAKSADSDLDDEKPQLDAQGNPVPYFVYMASVGPEGIARGKTGIAPHIGVTQNPLLRVDEINRKGPRNCPRDCQKGSPYWTLQLVVAPFFGGSNGFQQFWVKKSRKLARRLVFGARLALGTFSDKSVYCADMELVVKLLAEVLGVTAS